MNRRPEKGSFLHDAAASERLYLALAKVSEGQCSEENAWLYEPIYCDASKPTEEAPIEMKTDTRSD